HTFEGYLSNSGELAPIGASRIHTLSEAIAPYLRRAAANQTDLQKLNYEKYVEQLSTLATNWESLPEFQAKSVDDTVETYTENAIGDLPLNIQEQLRKQIVNQTETQTPKPNVNSPVRDREGDIKMSGADIYSIVSTVISAISNGNNPKGFGQTRPLDKRPNAPHCSEEERNQRLKSGRCIRCNRVGKLAAPVRSRVQGNVGVFGELLDQIPPASEIREAVKRLNSSPFLIDILINSTCYSTALFDTGCLPYAVFDRSFADQTHLPRLPVTHRSLKLAKDGPQIPITEMTWATLDIDGRAERVFGYIVANLQYNIILGKGWAERNNVTYEAGKKFLTLGSGANAIKVKESGWMERDELSGSMHQLRQAKNVTASIFAAEIRRGRKANKHLHLFSITIADINKALKKLDNSAVKQTVEEISNQLPQQLRHLAKNFLADEDGVLPESKPGWDHSISLELDDEGKPKEPPSGPLYGMSRDELLVLRKTLTDYLRKGWIRASNSPANAPVLFAKKPGGGLRFYVDYRGLNSITKRDRYPLPLIKETLQQLSKAQYFTKLDVCTAFHRLRIRPGDEWKTAFRTRYGQYEWLVMPFGLCGGPVTFQRYINAVLQDILDEYCSAYMDDVIIYSDGDLSDHYKKVEEVIRRLEESGLRLDINKCTFATSEVKYLGFVIKAGEGVTVDPAKIEAIKNWEEPTTVSETRSFLGFANFYREFIPKFSAIAQPLISLTSKQTRWSWDTKEKDAFEKLKSMLSSAPLLALFSAEKETYLEADASGYAIGGVLSQIDEKNRLRPVGYFSRKLTPAESNYNIHDKELLAIITTMR
ncbi:hypothetical protein K3495_g14368, partial [Podosphaera aphanis]